MNFLADVFYLKWVIILSTSNTKLYLSLMHSHRAANNELLQKLTNKYIHSMSS